MSSYSSGGGRQQRKRPRDHDEEQYRRPRPPVNTLANLKRDLIRLADPGSIALEEDLRFVAKSLATEFAITAQQERIFEILDQCVTELPIKIPHFGAVIVLAGGINNNFAQEVTQHIADCSASAEYTKDWLQVKLWLRLSCYTDRLRMGKDKYSMYGVTELFDTTEVKEPASSPAIWNPMVEAALLTLPYLAVNGYEASDLNAIVDKAEAFVKQHTKSSVPERPFKRTIGKSMSPVDALLLQCQHMRATDWKVNFVPNFQGLFEDVGDLDADSSNESSHIVFEGDNQLQTEAEYFQLYVDQDIETVPPVTHMASSVFRDIICDTLNALHYNRKESARFLIDLESYLPPGLFVLRGTPLDKIPADGPTWKAEDVVVEAIFAQLFRLPRPVHKPVYYHSVLTELCKLVPQAIAPTFGRAIRSLHDNLENFEPALNYRFWEWFSHHLSNFGFNWKWNEWLNNGGTCQYDPRYVFQHQTIAKEVELSYMERIKATLPEDYHNSSVCNEPQIPLFAYREEQTRFYAEAQSLVALLQNRADTNTLTEYLDDFKTKAEAADLDSNAESIKLLMHCILQNGYQSFSHALDTIEHNLVIMKNTCSSNDANQAIAIAAVWSFWAQRPFVASTILQKLVNYRIFSPANIMHHILRQNGLVGHSVKFELLESSMDKVFARRQQAREAYQEARSKNGVEVDTDPIAAASENLALAKKDEFELYRELITFANSKPPGPPSPAAEDQRWKRFWEYGLREEFYRQLYLRIPELRPAAGESLSMEMVEKVVL